MRWAGTTIRLWPLVLFWAMLCGVSLAGGLVALDVSGYPWRESGYTLSAVNAIVGFATLWCVAMTVFGLRRMRRTGRVTWGVVWMGALAGFLGGALVLAVLMAVAFVTDPVRLDKDEIVRVTRHIGRYAGVAGAIGGAVGLLFGLLWRIPLRLARRTKESP